MVMVAHLLVPVLEPEKPATFSKKTVTSLLREGMEFNGLIVSDALDMGALAGIYSQEEITIRCVEAGIDILLYPMDAAATIGAVVSAVEQGRLTHQRISESVERITAVKTRLGLFDKTGQKIVHVDSRRHQRIARKIGRKALCIVYGNTKMFPLKRDGGTACFILDDDNGADTGDVFIRMMREHFKYLSIMVLSQARTCPNPDEGQYHRRGLRGPSGIFQNFRLEGTFGAHGRSADRAIQILRVAKAAKTKSVVISFDSPYLLALLKDADARSQPMTRWMRYNRRLPNHLQGNNKRNVRSPVCLPLFSSFFHSRVSTASRPRSGLSMPAEILSVTFRAGVLPRVL